MKEAFTALGAWERRGGCREGGSLIPDHRAEAHGCAQADRRAEARGRAEAHGQAEPGGRWRGAGGIHQKANDIMLWVFFFFFQDEICRQLPRPPASAGAPR